MKKCLMVVWMSLLGLFILAGCVPAEDDSDDSDTAADSDTDSDSDSDSDSDTDTDTDSDADTDSDTDTMLDYSWEEKQVLSIKNAEHYNWAINDQVNVLVAFVAGDEADHLLSTATLVMENKVPWLWLATVNMDEAPEVFDAAGVETASTLKFFSYGVEMSELTLTGEATDMQVTDNAQALIDRYEPDILEATTAEELVTMLSDPATPILVKFGATWCGPCNFMIPRLELASIEYGDDLLDADDNYIYDEKRLTIIDVDVDDVPGMGDEYGFSGIPFFIFYNDGVRYNDLLGSRYYQTLTADIDAFLATLPEE